VLDTNVLVSAAVSSRGAPARVLAAWRAGSFELVTSDPLLRELAAVLARADVRRRTGYSPADNDAFVAGVAVADVVKPEQRIDALSDDADNRLLEAALAGDAEYIVTGDSDVLALNSLRGVRIVTPAAFIAMLERGGGSR